MKPYWIKILEYYHSKKRTGSTIPFVIGSKGYSNEKELQSITELINEVVNYEEKKIALFYCNQVKEYVLTIDPNFTNGFLKNTKSIGNFLILPSNSFLKGVEELEYIIDCFDIFYQENINSKKFSRENETWIFFTEEDDILIKKAYEFES